MLHVERVFAGMRWADASRVAAAVVMDVCRRCLRDDDVQTLLGHASIATTEGYTAVDDDEVRAAMLSAL